VKNLYLLRHAKSSWDDPGLADHDRPLAPRGRRAVKRMAEYLREAKVSPELVLCSSATRTRQTLDRIRPALDADAFVEVEADLYGADADSLLRRLRRVPDTTGSVLVIGHNPGMQDLALELSNGGAALGRVRETFPTCALATVEVPAERWADIEPGSAKLVGLVVPKELAR